jgi:hypothetical protein
MQKSTVGRNGEVLTPCRSRRERDAELSDTLVGPDSGGEGHRRIGCPREPEVHQTRAPMFVSLQSIEAP